VKLKIWVFESIGSFLVSGPVNGMIQSVNISMIRLEIPEGETGQFVIEHGSISESMSEDWVETLFEFTVDISNLDQPFHMTHSIKIKFMCVHEDSFMMKEGVEGKIGNQWVWIV
jgi:hypothetical protein